MITALLLNLSLVSMGHALPNQDSAPKYGTFKVDVVALLRDRKTVDGSQQFFADRLGYRYLFTSEESRKEFLQAPQRYEVQLGGACGKMAELSGRGSTDRYWVYKRRLYVFASDGCRTGFQGNPEGFLDRDDRAPKATSAELARGAQLVAQARVWTGLNKWDAKKSLELFRESKLEQGQRTYQVRETVRFGPGTDYFELTTYDGSGYGLKFHDSGAFEIDPEGKEEALVPTWKRALERRRARSLAYILLTRPSNRNQFVLKSSAGGVATVDAYVDRALSTLRIQEGTGRVLGFATRERANNGVLGTVDRTFTQFSTANGLTLPIAWTATYNGVESPSHARQGFKVVIGG